MGRGKTQVGREGREENGEMSEASESGERFSGAGGAGGAGGAATVGVMWLLSGLPTPVTSLSATVPFTVAIESLPEALPWLV